MRARTHSGARSWVVATLFAAAAPARAADWALLVGVGRYPVPDWRLQAPRNDLVLMSDWCRRLGFARERIIILRDADATRAAVLEKLRMISRQVRATDHVIFYFSGHGALVADVFGPAAWRGDEARRRFADLDDEALVMWDTHPGDPMSFLLDDHLSEAMRAITRRGARVTSVLDCCFAYDGAKVFGPDIGAVKTIVGCANDQADAHPAGLKAFAPNMEPPDPMDLGCNVLVAACGPREAVRELYWSVGRHRTAISALTLGIWALASRCSGWGALGEQLKRLHARFSLAWKPTVAVSQGAWKSCAAIQFQQTFLLTDASDHVFPALGAEIAVLAQ